VWHAQISKHPLGNTYIWSHVLNSLITVVASAWLRLLCIVTSIGASSQAAALLEQLVAIP